MNETRFCCKNVPIFKIKYDGGSSGDYLVFVCPDHLEKYPFQNDRIVSKVCLIK